MKMVRQHKFKRVFMSSLTTLECCKCLRCGTTAESNWNDKWNEKEKQKINGLEECNAYSILVFPFVFIKELIINKLSRKEN